MKKFLQIVVAAAVALAVATPTFAADKKKGGKGGPRTITGQAVCPKCCLKDGSTECGNAIQLDARKGKDGKEIPARVIYVVGDVAKDNHSLFCKGNKRATVTGTIKREGKGKDAKMVLTATKVEEAKGKGKGKGKGKKKKKDA